MNILLLEMACNISAIKDKRTIKSIMYILQKYKDNPTIAYQKIDELNCKAIKDNYDGYYFSEVNKEITEGSNTLTELKNIQTALSSGKNIKIPNNVSQIVEDKDVIINEYDNTYRWIDYILTRIILWIRLSGIAILKVIPRILSSIITFVLRIAGVNENVAKFLGTSISYTITTLTLMGIGSWLSNALAIYIKNIGNHLKNHLVDAKKLIIGTWNKATSLFKSDEVPSHGTQLMLFNESKNINIKDELNHKYNDIKDKHLLKLNLTILSETNKFKMNLYNKALENAPEERKEKIKMEMENSKVEFQNIIKKLKQGD